MRSVRRQCVIGMLLQAVVLTALAAVVGLRPLGWIVGFGCGAAVAVGVVRGVDPDSAVGFGPANQITRLRAALVGGVAALVADRSLAPSSATAAVVLVAAVALVLDNIDGRVARRTATVTEFGARFDMEVDAFLILVLSVDAIPTVGAWVMAIGLMRYALGAGGAVAPWLCATVPPRDWRKRVAAVQGVVLTVAVSGGLPVDVAVAAVGGALALLVESFGRDVVWLWRQHATQRRAPQPLAVPRDRRLLEAGAQ